MLNRLQRVNDYRIISLVINNYIFIEFRVSSYQRLAFYRDYITELIAYIQMDWHIPYSHCQTIGHGLRDQTQ